MSLPWLLVAALPRLALWLPKPGRWMGRLRILLGLMMLGSSLWLASLLGNHLGSTATGWLMAAMVLALLMGILWRYGLRGFTLALSLSALIGGALLLGRPHGERGGSVDRIAWQPLSEQAITDALAQNKRVFVDVTADWCVTCKANKYNVLLRDEVQRALSAPDVVALRGDWSRPSDAISAFLRQRGAAAVPFNQIYGPGLPGGGPLSCWTRPTCSTACTRPASFRPMPPISKENAMRLRTLTLCTALVAATLGTPTLHAAPSPRSRRPASRSSFARP